MSIMLRDALLLTIVLVAVPMAAGHAILHVVRPPQHLTPALRLLIGLATGLSAQLVALAGALFLVPVHEAAPWIAVAAVALALLTPGAPRAIASDLALAVRLPAIFWFAACVTSSLIAGAFVLGTGGGTVQGTENLDAFHYVATAAWLQSHAFGAPLPDAGQSAMREFIERAVTFSHPLSMPRVGSEALVAYAASLLGSHVEQIYSLIVLGTTMLLALGTFALMDVGARGWGRGACLTAAVLIGLSPITLFTQANSNFPTLVGAALLCATILAWPGFRAAHRAWPRLEVALLLAAIAFTYPELVPVAGLALLVLAVAQQGMRQRFVAAVALAATCLLSVLIFSWAWWLGAQSLFVAQHVSAIQGSAYPSLFAELNAFEGLAAFLTLTPAMPRAAPMLVDVMIAASLLAAIAVGLATERQPRRLLALSAPFVVLVCYVFLRDFNYGKFKVVQYLAPFLAACAAAGIVELGWRKSAGPALRAALMVVAVIAAASWLGASAVLEQSAYNRSRHAHLSSDHLDLGRAVESARRGGALLITDEHSLHDAFWAAYLWEPRPVLMLGGLAGWSANPLERLSVERAVQVGYVLESPADVVQSAAGAALVENERFIVRAVGPVLVVPVAGLSGLEPGYRWMGQELHLLVNAERSFSLLVEIAGQFPSDAPEAALVAVENASGQIDVRGGVGTGTINVPAGRHVVKLRVTRPAVSPASLGVGSDPRPLTYQIRALKPLPR